MKRRWIIRGFFIGLLMLCIGGWGWSYKTCGYIWYRYTPHKGYCVSSEGGRIFVTWGDNPDPSLTSGWEFGAAPAQPLPDKELSFGVPTKRCYSILGFFLVTADGEAWAGTKLSVFMAGVPYSVLLLVTAALLVLVLRKTHPKPDPKTAFPVGVQSSKAK